MATSPNQTDTLSTIILGHNLPYEIDINENNQSFSGGLPTLQGYIEATTNDGKWLLISGRTAGLHGFSDNPNNTDSFPPSSYNREAWVIDFKNHQSWSRSLDDLQEFGISQDIYDPLISTGVAAYQEEDKLYVAGGYRYDSSTQTYTTSSQLTVINVPDLMNWVQGGDLAADTIKQTENELFRVAGGEMFEADGTTHLVFGFDYQGAYTPSLEGSYTNQVRSFEIVEEGNNLTVENITQTTPDDNYRRRDLNMVSVINGSPIPQPLTEEEVVLSGVFTEAGGIWTVPVEIDAEGNPTMADPNADSTFKQGMNGYTTANVGLYSQETGEMHNLLFGGISLQYYDPDTKEFVTDNQIPFINQSSSVIIDEYGNFSQELLMSPNDPQLPLSYPEITLSDGNEFLFGAASKFLLADGIETYDNDVIDLDKLTQPTVIGHIFGGIAAEQPNFGNSTASGYMFDVLYTPVEPVIEKPGLINQGNGVFEQIETQDISIQYRLAENAQGTDLEFGYIPVDNLEGDINILSPGEEGYTEAALARKVAVIDSNQGGATNSLSSQTALDSLSDGQVLTNTESQNVGVLENNTTITEQPVIFYVTQNEQTILSVINNEADFTELNTGRGYHQFSFLDSQEQNIVIEAGTGVLITPSPTLNREIIQAEINFSRAGYFENTLGIYEVDNLNGGLDVNGDGFIDFNPGDNGYAQAAVEKTLDPLTGVQVNAPDDFSNSSNLVTLAADAIFGMFIIVNASVDDFLTKNPDNNPSLKPNAFFSYDAANPDGVSHVLQLGRNIYGFEDLLGGGDRDYNDFVFGIDFLA